MSKQQHINKILDNHFSTKKENSFLSAFSGKKEKQEEAMPHNIDELNDSNKILIIDSKPNFLQTIWSKIKSLFSMPVKKEGYEEVAVEEKNEPEEEISQEQIDELVKRKEI